MQAHLRFMSGTSDMRTVNKTTSNTIATTLTMIICFVLLTRRINSFIIHHSRISQNKFMIPAHLLPTGSEKKGVLEVGSIPVAILPSCQYIKIIAL